MCTLPQVCEHVCEILVWAATVCLRVLRPWQAIRFFFGTSTAFLQNGRESSSVIISKPWFNVKTHYSAIHHIHSPSIFICYWALMYKSLCLSQLAECSKCFLWTCKIVQPLGTKMYIFYLSFWFYPHLDPRVCSTVSLCPTFIAMQKLLSTLTWLSTSRIECTRTK